MNAIFRDFTARDLNLMILSQEQNHDYVIKHFVIEILSRMILILRKPKAATHEKSLFHPKAKISWFDLANDIKVIYGFNTIINPVTTEEYPTKAKRPKYSLLDKTKIKNTFNITLIPYKDSLKKCIKILKNET